jgi:hypothetical protein
VTDRQDPTQQESELNRLWNDIVSGETKQGAYDLPAGDTQMLSQFQQRVTRSQPDSARERAWQRTLARIEPNQSQQSQKESTMHTVATLPPSGYLHSPNGRAGPRRWDGFVPEIGRARTARRRHIAQLVAAVLLLVGLGIGYLAFNPFGGGPDRPSSIPAAGAPLATPGAAESTPTPTPYPMTDHPIIGTWEIDLVASTPGAITTHFWFGDDGSFYLADDLHRIVWGTWRATGERTGELAFVLQGVRRQDLFDPNYVAAGLEPEPRFELWRLTITVDASGNAMTLEGQWDYSFGDGSLYKGDPQHATGIRMESLQADTGAPTS